MGRPGAPLAGAWPAAQQISFDLLYKQVDGHLYAAKEGGRNRTVARALEKVGAAADKKTLLVLASWDEAVVRAGGLAQGGHLAQAGQRTGTAIDQVAGQP